MNMSIPSCSTVQTRQNAVMMLSRITIIIITAVTASLAIYQNNRRMLKVHLCNVVIVVVILNKSKIHSVFSNKTWF